MCVALRLAALHLWPPCCNRLGLAAHAARRRRRRRHRHLADAARAPLPLPPAPRAQMVSPEGVGPDSPDHYMNIPQKLIRQNPGKYFDIDQYDNLKNPEGHFKTLGPEIWQQTEGKVTHFLAGCSTGGTISGTSQFLKSQNPNVEVILPDPVGSIFKEYFETGAHKPAKNFNVEGVGKDSIPGALDINIVDRVYEVTDDEAFTMCHRLARTEGLLVGGSSGLNTHAAVVLANDLCKPCCIVTILCDSGIKYLTKVFNPAYLEAKGISVDQADEPAAKKARC